MGKSSSCEPSSSSRIKNDYYKRHIKSNQPNQIQIIMHFPNRSTEERSTTPILYKFYDPSELCAYVHVKKTKIPVFGPGIVVNQDFSKFEWKRIEIVSRRSTSCSSSSKDSRHDKRSSRSSRRSSSRRRRRSRSRRKRSQTRRKDGDRKRNRSKYRSRSRRRSRSRSSRQSSRQSSPSRRRKSIESRERSQSEENSGSTSDSESRYRSTSRNRHRSRSIHRSRSRSRSRGRRRRRNVTRSKSKDRNKTRQKRSKSKVDSRRSRSLSSKDRNNYDYQKHKFDKYKSELRPLQPGEYRPDHPDKSLRFVSLIKNPEMKSRGKYDDILYSSEESTLETPDLTTGIRIQNNPTDNPYPIKPQFKRGVSPGWFPGSGPMIRGPPTPLIGPPLHPRPPQRFFGPRMGPLPILRPRPLMMQHPRLLCGMHLRMRRPPLRPRMMPNMPRAKRLRLSISPTATTATTTSTTIIETVAEKNDQPIDINVMSENKETRTDDLDIKVCEQGDVSDQTDAVGSSTDVNY